MWWFNIEHAIMRHIACGSGCLSFDSTRVSHGAPITALRSLLPRVRESTLSYSCQVLDLGPSRRLRSYSLLVSKACRTFSVSQQYNATRLLFFFTYVSPLKSAWAFAKTSRRSLAPDGKGVKRLVVEQTLPCTASLPGNTILIRIGTTRRFGHSLLSRPPGMAASLSSYGARRLQAFLECTLGSITI
jgi:hypothetical protein